MPDLERKGNNDEEREREMATGLRHAEPPEKLRGGGRWQR
jgi:hypothetical protein